MVCVLAAESHMTADQRYSSSIQSFVQDPDKRNMIVPAWPARCGRRGPCKPATYKAVPILTREYGKPTSRIEKCRYVWYSTHAQDSHGNTHGHLVIDDHCCRKVPIVIESRRHTRSSYTNTNPNNLKDLYIHRHNMKRCCLPRADHA